MCRKPIAKGRNQMNKSDFFRDLEKEAQEIPPIWANIGDESDRGLGIVAACYLDNLLEKLIRVLFIKQPQVNSLFKDDHILQSFFAKINITYFSGIIPKFIYHDLKLICTIRNRFAHAVVTDLHFSDRAIAQLIDKCELRPREIDEYNNPKLKFVIVVSQIGVILRVLEILLAKIRPSHLMELIKLDEAPYEKFALSKKQIIDVLVKNKNHSKH